MKTVNQFNLLLEKFVELVRDDELLNFVIHREDLFEDGDGCSKSNFMSQIGPVLNCIENVYIKDINEERISKIGILYTSIEDQELQKRCSDILVGESAFDRVINQATQVLEDRIKKKSELEGSRLIGIDLISKAIHSKIEETILLLDEKSNIQESWSQIFKGIMGIYRNPTHHGTDYVCTREEALKFCVFIDTLLPIIDKSKKIR